MLNTNKNLQLANYVLKRYEPSEGLYYFFNAKSEKGWCCNETVGSVISVLNGTLDFLEIIDILSENNPDVDKNDIRKLFQETFDLLLKEGFIVYSD